MTSKAVGLSDPGGVRPVAMRWAITADLVLESAAHFGGGPGDAAGTVLLRDVREGRPLLPGTSLAGALRSHLADVLGGYRSDEDPRVARLFGCARGDDLGRQSPLIVFDSLGILPDGRPVEIRDGVQIEACRGTAEEHKKFDLEVLPAGTRFRVRLELIVPEANTEEELLSLLVTSLNGLSKGDLALGARRSRGLGALHTGGWRAVRHDLGTSAGWLDWLGSDPVEPIGAGIQTSDDPAEACQCALPSFKFKAFPDQRCRLVFKLALQAKAGLLVRSAPVEPAAPDAVHLRSAGRSVLPGTSLAGVLRARALRIARVVRGRAGDAEQWVESIFGPRNEGTTPENDRDLWASRLRLSESLVENGTRLRQTRIRIDRLTQGVVPGALFEEELEHGSTICVRGELRGPAPGEAGLLLLVLKDLLDGDLPVGGTSSVGRGALCGSGELILENSERIVLEVGSRDGPDVEHLDRLIRESWEAPSSPGGES